MRILAVIPARGGSKGIPNKNLAKLGNYSLVAIAVKNALKNCCFTKVHYPLIVYLYRKKPLNIMLIVYTFALPKSQLIIQILINH